MLCPIPRDMEGLLIEIIIFFVALLCVFQGQQSENDYAPIATLDNASVKFPDTPSESNQGFQCL